jgi:hypothetical protein
LTHIGKREYKTNLPPARYPHPLEVRSLSSSTDWRRRLVRQLIIVLSLLTVLVPCVAAEDPPKDPAPKPSPSPSPAEKSPEQKLDDANKNFLGVKFNFGFGGVFFGGRVEEAQIVGEGDSARVVVTKDSSKRPALVLESHRLLDIKANSRRYREPKTGELSDPGHPKEPGALDTQKVKFALGPFLAIQTSQNEAIDTIGLGVMGGFHVGDGSSFNIGIGAILDPVAKILPPGYVDGAPPPKGYVAGDKVAGGGTAISLVTKGKMGLIILASFTF